MTSAINFATHHASNCAHIASGVLSRAASTGSSSLTAIKDIAKNFFSKLGAFLKDHFHSAISFIRSHKKEAVLVGLGVGLAAVAIAMFNKIFQIEDDETVAEAKAAESTDQTYKATEEDSEDVSSDDGSQSSSNASSNESSRVATPAPPSPEASLPDSPLAFSEDGE